jgi:hypothetical protein
LRGAGERGVRAGVGGRARGAGARGPRRLVVGWAHLLAACGPWAWEWTRKVFGPLALPLWCEALLSGARCGMTGPGGGRRMLCGGTWRECPPSGFSGFQVFAAGAGGLQVQVPHELCPLRSGLACGVPLPLRSASPAALLAALFSPGQHPHTYARCVAQQLSVYFFASLGALSAQQPHTPPLKLLFLGKDTLEPARRCSILYAGLINSQTSTVIVAGKLLPPLLPFELHAVRQRQR